MSHHPAVPGWQIAAADMAQRRAAKNQAQAAVDAVYRSAAATERYYAATGEYTDAGLQAVIERDDLQARGVLPSWQSRSSSPIWPWVLTAAVIIFIVGFVFGGLSGAVILLLMSVFFLAGLLVLGALIG